MNTQFFHKRAYVTGRTPSASELDLGELGINTQDGHLFLKQEVGELARIIEVGRTVITGDASGVGNQDLVLTLTDTGVAPGRYTRITVDSKGRALLGEQLEVSDVPDLPWSKITDRPTTIEGYGLTDAAPKNSPVLTGTPTAPTPAAADNSLKIANTEFVQRAVAGSMSGNAATATALRTVRAIALKGDATGTADFDGTADASIQVTLSNSGVAAGTYPSVTVDAKGRVTAGSGSVAITGGTVNGATIGQTAPAAGSFTTLSATGGNLNGVAIGQTTAAAARVTTLATTGNANVGGNLVVAGNLTVQGDSVVVNTSTMQVEDPVITVGGQSAPTADDNKDRGVEFRWHDGTSAKRGFFGFDDSTGKFTFIPNASNNGEVFSGSKGTLDAFIAFADVTARPTTLAGYGITDSLTTTAADARFQPLSPVLTSLAGRSDLGIYVHTAANTVAARSIVVADISRLSVTNGNGVSGNPTIDLAMTPVMPGIYTKVTVDTYGRVIAAENPTTLAGHGILDAYTKVEADARFAKGNFTIDQNLRKADSVEFNRVTSPALHSTSRFGVGTAPTSNITADIYAEHTVNGSRYGIRNRLSLTNETLTANRAQYAAYNEVLSDALTTDGYRNSAYGAYNRVRTSLTDEGAGSLYDATANYNLVISYASDPADSKIEVARGSYNHIQQYRAGTIVTAYGTYNRLDRDAGEIQTAFGVYNSFEGTIGVKWGIYSNGDDLNYLTGSLGLGVKSPTAKLDVAGTGKFSSTLTAGSFAGNGNGITNLNADSLGTGMVPAARLNPDLAAIHNNTANGIYARTASGVVAVRQIVGASGRIQVGNPNGVDGNPTIDLMPSGVLMGTYTRLTVDAYGRVTAGSSPNSLYGMGITDAYTKAEVNALILDSLPAGAIIPWVGIGAIPSGFLLCNGSAPSRTTYSRLFGAIGTLFGAGNGSTTFHLPDGRGEFLRGADAGRGVDPGRTLGSWQGDMFASHTHRVKEGHSIPGGSGEAQTSGDDYTRQIAYWSTSEATGGSETRPRNIAVHYLIKY